MEHESLLEEGESNLSENENEEKEESPVDLIKHNRSDITKLLRVSVIEQWRYQVPALLITVVEPILEMSGNILLGKILQSVLNKEIHQMNQLTLIALGLFILWSIADGTRTTLQTTAAARIATNMRERVFSNVIEQEMGFFDSVKVGEIMSRLTTDANEMENRLDHSISFLLRAIIVTLGGSILLFTISWQLTLLSVAAASISAFIVFIQQRIVNKLTLKMLDEFSNLNHIAEELISNIRTVHLFFQFPKAKSSYTNSAENIFKIKRKIAIATGTSESAYEIAFITAMVGCVWLGGKMVINGTIEIGNLVSWALIAENTLLGGGLFSSVTSDLARAVAASKKLFALIERKSQVDLKGTLRLKELKGEIEFKDYPAREGLVLDRVSFKAAAGKRLSIVGQSGAGKSSILALITRLYEIGTANNTLGEILLDGQDIREFDLKWLRSQIAVVPQNISLFAGSIAENIAYGKPNKIIQAAKDAKVHDFIESLPQGYNSVVGHRGVQISGGQAQRIAIARAFIQEAKIVLLDEATSALDKGSESLIQEALSRLMENKTVIVVTHNSDFLRQGDWVVEMKQGKILSQGIHEKTFL